MSPVSFCRFIKGSNSYATNTSWKITRKMVLMYLIHIFQFAFGLHREGGQGGGVKGAGAGDGGRVGGGRG